MKKIILENEGGGYRIKDVIGDKENKTWGKIKGDFIFDYQVRGVMADIKRDGFKVAIDKGDFRWWL